MQPLSVDQLMALVNILQGHRNAFQKHESIARRLRKPTTTSPHLEHCLRSFKGRTLVLEQENKGPLGWLTVTTFAASHPEDIRCELSKDGSRIVRIKSRFANLENEDCLALQSKRLFPDAYAYDADDPELENEEVDTEERGLLRLRKELERGENGAQIPATQF